MTDEEDRDGPVDRPRQDTGDLFVFSAEDCADIAAEFYTFVRELPNVSDTEAEEAATMMFELMTGEWGQTMTDGYNPDDTDSDFKIN